MRAPPLLLVAVLLAAALLGLVGPAPAARPAGAGGVARYCAGAVEGALLALVNEHRAAHGVGPLALSPTLGAAAEHHARQMARADYFSHRLLGGVSWLENIRAHGYDHGTRTGENIAAGRGRAAAAFRQWRASPGHNENMLRADYAAIGVGRAFDADSTYGWYWVTTFGGVADAPAGSC